MRECHGEDIAQLVPGDLAEIGGLAAEIGHTRRRISGAAAGGFECRSHLPVQKLRALRIDEVHRALHDIVFFDEAFRAGGNDIDNRIADRQHVKRGHGTPLLK